MNRTLQTTLLGALGGFLGFVLSEVLVPQSGSGGFLGNIVGTAWWTALLMLPLTLLLLAGENLLSMRGRWSRGLAQVWLPALLLGACSGALAQFIYALGLMAGLPGRLMRALGWAVMGAGVGLLLGLHDRSPAKALRGALGGAAGGFLGGLVFDSFTALRFGEEDTGTLARLVGLTLLGAAIGFMLRLAQEFLKGAWLLGTTTGRSEGKQYILGKPAVTVGRSETSDISLSHDAQVPMQAGTLVQRGGNWHWEGEPILINRQPKTRAALRNGDRLTFGQTELVFGQRGQAASGRVPVPPLALQANHQAVHFPADFQQLSLGTGGELRVQGAGIQAHHAIISTLPDGTLELHAQAPLELNDRPLAAGTTSPLRPGDLLKLGDTEFALIKSEPVTLKQ
ncbi:hypothetical protein D3875_06565 [Deinococcus cavernae]|uniref:YscD cytoplasmic domain-containing protein n=1 Tax=Deinococcus cavernae TaxID=2320857 RepID=A0A418V5A1_9DEIO|nr:FHA domain-containing protein [Deinococcus cavernae]RJF71284.1 hypothetical protein D3875_06565 [Deinococcus cavernae]